MNLPLLWKLEQLGPDGWTVSAGDGVFPSSALAKAAGRLLPGFVVWRVQEQEQAE